MSTHDLKSDAPKTHTTAIRGEMQKLIEHLRADIAKMTEPRAQAMFETSAEVLTGLMKTFDDYDAGKEAALRA